MTQKSLREKILDERDNYIRYVERTQSQHKNILQKSNKDGGNIRKHVDKYLTEQNEKFKRIYGF